MDKLAQQQMATSSSLAEAVHATMRFARVLRHRKSYVLASFALFGVLGALYFATATRVYEAKASVLVVPHGSDVWSTSAAVDGSRQALIPTYERLFYEDVVLDGAVAYLQQEPESQIDFAERPPDQWSTVVRKNLSAKRVRRTNLIEIGYRSKSPRAAEAIVAAIARSYLDFMQKNHRNVSTEIVGILDKERVEIEERLEQKHLQLRSSPAVWRPGVERRCRRGSPCSTTCAGRERVTHSSSTESVGSAGLVGRGPQRHRAGRRSATTPGCI